MKRLLSISDDAYSLGRFGSADAVRAFIAEHQLHGIELVRWEKPQADPIPMDLVVGRHMPFWPMMLDFWRGDKEGVIRTFGSEQTARDYYYAKNKAEFAAQRRAEFIDAQKMNVEYVVVHISHAELMHCYSRDYTYTDTEIIDVYIDMMNEVLRGVDADFALLFENVWFPGLTLTDGDVAMRLLNGIDYANKGFVLDISHMMNMNETIRDEQHAVKFILETLESLGDARQYIKTIHMNSAIDRRLMTADGYEPDGDFMTRLIAAMKDVAKMDPHVPFVHPDIRKVVDAVQPEFITYELRASTWDELDNAVRMQNAALGVV